MSTGAREGLSDRVGKALEPAKAPTIKSMIEAQTREVERALPVHLKGSAEAYVRAAVSLVKQTPKLAQCDPMTILGGLMTASQLGLELGPLGHAYLVPYGNKAQLIIGYRGLLDLAWRSGKLTSIEAHEVYENDEFEFAYGLESTLVHKPTLGDRGPVKCYYCVAHFKGGGHYFLVMSRDEIEDHRKRSRSANNGPWVTDYNAMAKKTTIRAAAPFLPLTTEVLRDIAQDGVVASGSKLEDLEMEDVDYGTGEILDDDGVVDAEVVS